MAVALETLVAALGAEIVGDRRLAVEGAGAVDQAGPSDVTFVIDERHFKKLAHSRAGAAILSRALAERIPQEARPAALVLVEDPQAAFLKVLERLRPPRPRPALGISAAAFVSPSARIGKNTNIHPGAHVAEDVIIGDGCTICPGVSIGAGCALGDDVTLYPNVVLYHDVTLGSRVTIHAGTVIGADGFGYRLINGRHEKLPHFGTVRIEDDVEIGACSAVDRAMIGATVIGRGTKIDNMVQVAHNCELGPHNILAAQVGFAGSVTTGEYVVCAGQAGVRDHLRLGDRCTIAALS
ncbi:MAG: UDP-3-O-(3-hydroxymyristoyl)glucosamine N-acyltransferase, partial [Planctomycetaceae bacterium]